jgi:hypothetical protein
MNAQTTPSNRLRVPHSRFSREIVVGANLE